MKKVYLSILIIFLSAFLIIGCDGVAPSAPDDEYDEENTELAYIKVFPAQTEMIVNQSKKFEVKAYNSEDKLIAIYATKVEKWTCTYECWGCGVVCKLSQTQGSLQTKFTPERAGRYEVSVKYEGKWAKAEVEVN